MSLLRLCSSGGRQLFCKSPAVEPLFTGCLRAASRAVNDKEPLKKAKTPKGRFDNLEETSKDVLQKFPDDVNPVTKEKGAHGVQSQLAMEIGRERAGV